ncbi:MAG: ABC-F family ATP-binding cassette domain-containing protein [Actinomycetota bacterium]
MITISGLDKSFGLRDLFRGADLRVGARDRVALVGPNGSGKTSLLDMIAGDLVPDGGEIVVARDAVIGYLHQETDALRGRALIEEMLSAGAEVTETGHRLALLEEEMAELEPGDELDRLVAEYGRLQDRFSTLGGYTLESEAKRILAGLGFREEHFSRRTETFSGGWLMRIALAKLLLATPDILMLDEPTNHLDVESVEWLERFLDRYEGAVLLISHDRDFINGIATKVVEIVGAGLVTYTGNFESFARQREEVARQAEAAAKHQAREIAKTELFINRFRYKESKAKQVQSRIKALGRMERAEAPRRPRKTMTFSFPDPPRPGRDVVVLSGIRFGYDGNPVYDSLGLVVERGQKIALVGPNGAGKTTLLKLLAGELEPQSGERRLGHNVELGYFAQHQIEALDPANRVIEELKRAIPPEVDIKPRNLLGRFLFSGEEVDKPVAVLSGGERTRLALAKLLISPANILCLDEPTNHLDMQSRDVLEDALTEYSGALVLITHDRHLIRNVADRIVEVVDGKTSVFEGDYDYYLSKRRRVVTEGPSEPTPNGAPKKELRRRAAEARTRTKSLRDRVARIEAELDGLSVTLERLEAVMADPELYASGSDVAGLVRDYEGARARVRTLEAEWDDATRALEDAEV